MQNNTIPSRSESLFHPSGDGAKITIHLGRRLAKDERDDGLSRHVDVLVGAKDTDLVVGEQDAGTRGILDGELDLAVAASNSGNGTALGLAADDLPDVLDLETLD